jgi:hypothetical protein
VVTLRRGFRALCAAGDAEIRVQKFVFTVGAVAVVPMFFVNPNFLVELWITNIQANPCAMHAQVQILQPARTP